MSGLEGILLDCLQPAHHDPLDSATQPHLHQDAPGAYASLLDASSAFHSTVYPSGAALADGGLHSVSVQELHSVNAGALHSVHPQDLHSVATDGLHSLQNGLDWLPEAASKAHDALNNGVAAAGMLAAEGGQQGDKVPQGSQPANDDEMTTRIKGLLHHPDLSEMNRVNAVIDPRIPHEMAASRQEAYRFTTVEDIMRAIPMDALAQNDRHDNDMWTFRSADEQGTWVVTLHHPDASHVTPSVSVHYTTNDGHGLWMTREGDFEPLKHGYNDEQSRVPVLPPHPGAEPAEPHMLDRPQPQPAGLAFFPGVGTVNADAYRTGLNDWSESLQRHTEWLQQQAEWQALQERHQAALQDMVYDWNRQFDPLAPHPGPGPEPVRPAEPGPEPPRPARLDNPGWATHQLLAIPIAGIGYQSDIDGLRTQWADQFQHWFEWEERHIAYQAWEQSHAAWEERRDAYAAAGWQQIDIQMLPPPPAPSSAPGVEPIPPAGPGEHMTHSEHVVELTLYTPDNRNAIIAIQPVANANGQRVYQASVTSNNTGVPIEQLVNNLDTRVFVGYRGDQPEAVDITRSNPGSRMQPPTDDPVHNAWQGLYSSPDPSVAAGYTASDRDGRTLGAVSRVLLDDDVQRYLSETPINRTDGPDVLHFVRVHAQEEGIMFSHPQGHEEELQGLENLITPEAVHRAAVVPANGTLGWVNGHIRFEPDRVEDPVDPDYRVWLIVPQENQHGAHGVGSSSRTSWMD